MQLQPDWPHCPSCTCAAPVPSTFVSEVVALPVDLQRVARFLVGSGQNQRVDEHRALDLVSWVPERRHALRSRIKYYRLLVEIGTCGNIREAVVMTSIKRREFIDRETARHADRLARSARCRNRDGYERSLAHKKRLILAEGAPCSYCGAEAPQTVDHVVPISRRIDHRRRNLTPACWACNTEKGARTPAEWRRARLDSGLLWPPERRDPARRTFPGVLIKDGA